MFECRNTQRVLIAQGSVSFKRQLLPNIKAELGPYRNLRKTYKLNVVNSPTSELEVKQYKPRPSVFNLFSSFIVPRALAK